MNEPNAAEALAPAAAPVVSESEWTQNVIRGWVGLSRPESRGFDLQRI